MKRWIALFSLALLVGWTVASAEAATILEIDGALDAKEVVELTTEDVVVIAPKGIAGSQFEIAVDGPATATLYDLKQVNGGPALLGPAHKRVVVLPSKKGKVKVSITVKWPTGDKPTTFDYMLEVK